MTSQRSPSPIRGGAWLAILAAVSFGITAPLVKIVGAGAGPFVTAALLYLGAAGVSLVGSRAPSREPPPRAHHAPKGRRVPARVTVRPTV